MLQISVPNNITPSRQIQLSVQVTIQILNHRISERLVIFISGGSADPLPLLEALFPPKFILD